jgi:hypothetical protein
VKKKFKRKFEEGYHGSVRFLMHQQQGIHSTHHGMPQLFELHFGTTGPAQSLPLKYIIEK